MGQPGKSIDVALASCLELPEPDFDEALLTAALEKAGIRFRVLAWDDPESDWSAARLTLLRSTWDYPIRPAAFLAWAQATARVSELWNPLALVRWNLHKSYLLELEARGVAITPTVMVSCGSDRSLDSIIRGQAWSEVVVKPAISAASYRTMRVGPGEYRSGEAHLREIVAAGDALVQQYLPAVEDYGERGLVWIDGELTHGVRKSPRFEGEDESVSSVAVAISAKEASLVEHTLTALRELTGEVPMYARIDAAPGPNGDPVVMEFELIEPSLFFPQSERALALFVAAVERRLDG